MKPTGQLLMVSLVGWLATPALAQETIETTGRVDAVTVYRGQAYVTRLVEVPGPTGLREVVLTDLPQHVVPDSIYAESADGIEVRSVRYRTRPVQEDVRQEVRELDEQLREVADQIEAHQRRLTVLGEHRAYLATLENFVAPTADVELTRGVLNAGTLEQLSNFLLDQRRTMAEGELETQCELRSLEERQTLLQRQRNKLTGTSARTVREAVVFVNLLNEGGQLRLRYLVNQATWSPSYTVRATDDRTELTVDYYASIQQMSGEEWPDVEMTLSTATPSLTAKAPPLTPLTVALTSAGPGDLKQARRELSRRKGQVARDRAYRNLNLDAQPRQQAEQHALESADIDAMLNMVAGQLQVLEMVDQARVSRRGERTPPERQEGVSVSYELASRTTLPSRSDRQLIQIASMPMSADFYKLAVPVLTDYVYEEASATNDSDRVLLAGPVSTYLNDQFVGHGEVPMVAVGETFTVGLGIDPSLRTSRELVEKRESIQGGNRVVHFTYRLALENFGQTPASVRLLDRIPTAKLTQADIELVSPGGSISDDPTYQQSERKKGILRWDVEVPEQATGLQAFALEYRFDLAYDRQMTITAVAGTVQ
jgi:hypothetical protein